MRTLTLVLLFTGCLPKEEEGGNGGGGGGNETAETGETGDTGETGLPQQQVRLTQFASGMTAPTQMVVSPDGMLMVVDQTGVVWRVDGGTPTVFLDLSDKVIPLMPDYDERGLLGLAFHPDWPTDRRIYVWYSMPLRHGAPSGYDHTNVLSEFTLDDTGAIVAGSERQLIVDDHPYMNHNGGSLMFGPDRMLYLSIGDGGNKNDVGTGHAPMGNGQDTTSILGKILRIDPSTVGGEMPYGIPTDNPFADGTAGAPEVYAYGFRNPYAFSFDRETGDLYAGDEGEALMEEVDLVQLGGNYGWNIKEGTLCFNPMDENTPLDTCADVGAAGEPLVDPILTYGHPSSPGLHRDGEIVGKAVVGGRVYRGAALPWLQGSYVFGDWSSSETAPHGQLLVGKQDGGAWTLDRLPLEGGAADSGHFVRGFGEDASGELYLLTTDSAGPVGATGAVWRLDAVE